MIRQSHEAMAAGTKTLINSASPSARYTLIRRRNAVFPLIQMSSAAEALVPKSLSSLRARVVDVQWQATFAIPDESG
jgi:hypothetical protein